MTANLFMFLLLAIALAINTIGFRNIVHFVNVGYAFSIIAQSFLAILFFRFQVGIFSVLQLVGLLIWGTRLGIFVLRREARPSYQKESERLQNRYGNVNNPGKFLIWIAVSVLYVLMFLPALYHLTETLQFSTPIFYVVELSGGALLFGGLLLETGADQQKSAFKTLHPQEFCSIGLYQWVRCPNYLGEILIWIGSWVMGVPFYASFWQWLGSLIGLACIIFIMMGSTKRLEDEQEKRYGALPDYQNYIRSVPILFPFMPIYTFKKISSTGNN
jgi:steroid 5-alpha reductase family enzyme